MKKIIFQIIFCSFLMLLNLVKGLYPASKIVLERKACTLNLSSFVEKDDLLDIYSLIDKKEVQKIEGQLKTYCKTLTIKPTNNESKN